MILARLTVALPGPSAALCREASLWHLPRPGERVALGIEGLAPLRVEGVTHHVDLKGPPTVELAMDGDPADLAARLASAGFAEHDET